MAIQAIQGHDCGLGFGSNSLQNGVGDGILIHFENPIHLQIALSFESGLYADRYHLQFVRFQCGLFPTDTATHRLGLVWLNLVGFACYLAVLLNYS